MQQFLALACPVALHTRAHTKACGARTPLPQILSQQTSDSTNLAFTSSDSRLALTSPGPLWSAFSLLPSSPRPHTPVPPAPALFLFLGPLVDRLACPHFLSPLGSAFKQAFCEPDSTPAFPSPTFPALGRGRGDNKMVPPPWTSRRPWDWVEVAQLLLL